MNPDPALNRDTAVHPGGWALRRWHLWLLIIGLMIRLGFCLTLDKEASFAGWDGKEYFAYAQSLLNLKWDDYPRYFNSIRPPLYPIFLTPFVAFNGQSVRHIQFAQSLLGVLHAFLLAKIAGHWSGRRAGDFAFVLVLFHPFLIYYTAFILTEVLFITLLWSGIACLQRGDKPPLKTSARWQTLGAVTLGLGCLTRPTLQPFLIVAVLWIGWRMLRISSWAIALRRMAYFTVVVSALLLPWMIGNQWAHGELTLAPGGGPSMYAFSNSPDYLRMYQAQTKDEYYQIFGRLVEHFSVESGPQQETWMEEARSFRQNQKADWWLLQWYKFKHFWTPWVNPLIFSRTDFLISLFTVTPIFLLAAVELWRRRRARDPFLLLLVGLISVGYLVGGLLFHVQVRYRFPFVDMSFILLTAAFLGHLKLSKVTNWLRMRHSFPLAENGPPAIRVSDSCQP